MKKYLKITNRKDLPYNFWDHGINPITGIKIGRDSKVFRPEQLNKFKLKENDN